MQLNIRGKNVHRLRIAGVTSLAYANAMTAPLYLARHAETVYNAGARMQGHMAHTPLTHAGIALHPDSRQVTLDGTALTLTAREYNVLHALLLRKNSIVSRADQALKKTAPHLYVSGDVCC